VQKNADVNGSILALFEGQSLPDSSALTMPPDQLAFATGSSSAASGTATAATLGLTASATGIGSVTAGFYVQGGSPVGEPLFRANGIYFDVRVAPGSEFTSLEITDCATSGATGVEWWDTAGQRWTTVSSPTYNASTGCINIIVTASTSPSLNQLSGTVFGLTTTPSGGTATPPPTPTPTPTPTPAPTPTPSPSLSAVGLSDGIAAGVNRGTKGFSISSAVVAPHGYITLLVQTNPNLAGSLVQIWVKSKTSDWHALTTRLVATDGTVHFFARVSGWTGYWVKFPGDTTHTPAASHGRIATTKI
jgi:hypothetical protein